MSVLFSEKLESIHLLFKSKHAQGNLSVDKIDRYYKRKEIAEKYIKIKKVRDHLLNTVNNMAFFYEKATPKRRVTLCAAVKTREYYEYLVSQEKMDKLLIEFKKI